MSAVLRVKGWADFQHYKGRRPPWIKLHRQLLDDYDFHRLPVASKALAPMLWLLASEYDSGEVPWQIDQVAFRLRMSEAEVQRAVTPLISSGFFVMIADEDSGASVALANGKRGHHPEERRGETEGETEKEENMSCGMPLSGESPDPAAFAADVFAEVWSTYPRRPNNPKAKAFRAWCARIREGVSPADLRAGVEAYRAYVEREHIEPRYVKLASTFFGPDRHWETDYGAATDGEVRVYDEHGNPTPEFLAGVGLA